MAQRQGRERGESLIEVLISLIVIGTVIAALVAGLGIVSTASANHRKDTTADGALRAFAEAMKSTTYVVGGAYPASLPISEYTPIAGYTVTMSAAAKCLTAADTTGNANAANIADFPACTVGNDAGVQLLTLKVTYGSSGVQTFSILKRKQL